MELSLDCKSFHVRKSTKKIICRGQAHFSRVSAFYSFGKGVNRLKFKSRIAIIIFY